MARQNSRDDSPIKTCPVCLLEFSFDGSPFWFQRVYCSYRCQQGARLLRADSRQSRPCERCGVPLPRFTIGPDGGRQFDRGWPRRRYCEDCKPIAEQEKHLRYLASSKGLKFRRRAVERYRGSPEEFAKHRVLAHDRIYEAREPCVMCGEINIAKLRLDHIVARGLGGPTIYENTQVLCVDCHREKTKRDMEAIRAARGV